MTTREQRIREAIAARLEDIVRRNTTEARRGLMIWEDFRQDTLRDRLLYWGQEIRAGRFGHVVDDEDEAQPAPPPSQAIGGAGPQGVVAKATEARKVATAQLDAAIEQLLRRGVTLGELELVQESGTCTTDGLQMFSRCYVRVRPKPSPDAKLLAAAERARIAMGQGVDALRTCTIRMVPEASDYARGEAGALDGARHELAEAIQEAQR